MDGSVVLEFSMCHIRSLWDFPFKQTYSAVLKARVKFFSRSLALRDEKSNAEGKKR